MLSTTHTMNTLTLYEITTLFGIFLETDIKISQAIGTISLHSLFCVAASNMPSIKIKELLLLLHPFCFLLHPQKHVSAFTPPCVLSKTKK